MQTYHNQGGIIQGRAQLVREYVGNLQDNTEALRSNFSGSSAPESPTIGQTYYNITNGVEYTYTSQGWIPSDQSTGTYQEVVDARGQLANLNARLSVALNEDGTLKVPAELDVDEWKDPVYNISYVSENSFTVQDDMTSVFTQYRALKIRTSGDSYLTSVLSSEYNQQYNVTTVITSDPVVPTEITSVSYSLIQYGLPKNIVDVASENGERKPSTVYSVGDIRYNDSLPTGWFLECSTAGTSDSGELVIGSPVVDDSVTDGTVVWTIKKLAGAAPIPIASSNTLGGVKIGSGINVTSEGVISSLYTVEDKAKLDSINIDESGAVITKTGRYGIRIDKRNSDPNTRVEYIYDAQGMGPAGMDFTNGVFNYGDWANLWFVKNNKPVMLKSDGTEDYELNPNNYLLKADGTDSDVANLSYDGNAMSKIPTVWVKRWEDGRYEYEVICDHQYDETYKAYAHTAADGTIKDYFYYSMFGGSGNASKIRSLSGKTLAQSLTATNEITGATANGARWYTHTWSQRELIRTLLCIMGKTTDTQSVFGYGNCRSASSASGMLTTGTLNDKGQFFGYNDSTHQVKVFHIEKFWGDQWDRVAGVINDRGKYYIKMTPEDNGYRITDTNGYVDTGLTVPAGGGTYINGMKCTEYGMLPNLASGSSTTYYCDIYYTNNSQLNYLLVGASAYDASSYGGAFAFAVSYAPSFANWSVGCGLSYI